MPEIEVHGLGIKSPGTWNLNKCIFRILFTIISLRDKQGRQVFHITVETSEPKETRGKEYQYQNWFLFFLIFFLMQAGVLEALEEVPSLCWGRLSYQPVYD